MLQGEYLHPREHKKLIFTDASNTGWDTHLAQNSTGGLWSLFKKAPSHQPSRDEGGSSGSAILQDKLNNQVLIASDNTSVVSYINKQGGTKSADLCALMWRILTWCHQNNVKLRARHVPGLLNMIAYGLSRRNQIQSIKWSLSPQIFKQISKLWESPQVDLFATSLNKFWDLVEMSLDIPRQLPPIRTLLKQPLNNHYHSNPISLNLHIWYLGIQHSKNMVSLQKWQKELLLLRDSQQDPSTHASGPFPNAGAQKNRWTSGIPL